MSQASRIADTFETGGLLVALAIHGAGEAALARAHARREILQHNARVAAVRAARARKRSAAETRRHDEIALGQKLMGRFLENRRLVD